MSSSLDVSAGSSGADPIDPFVAARAAALDELARPEPTRLGRRRLLFRRDGPSPSRGPDTDRSSPGTSGTAGAVAPADPSAGYSAGALAGTSAGTPGGVVASPPVRRAPVGPWWLPSAPRLVAGAAVVVLVGVLLASVVWLRRPAPAEETLPRADTSATVPAGPASTPVVTDPAASTPDGTGDSAGPVTVHVAGAVTRPGVVALPSGSRVVDAVGAAGGMVAGADPDRVNLAARLADGQRVVVPVVGQPVPAEVAVAAPAGPGSRSPAPSPASAAGPPVDLNTATESDLDALPGIGPATASAIVAHRTDRGPFRSVDDLLDVRGIGDAKLEALRDLVVVSG